MQKKNMKYGEQRNPRMMNGSQNSLNANQCCIPSCPSSPAKLMHDVYRDPTPPPLVECVYSREPTPEPDVIEKIIIKRQPQKIIENITQKPKKPPPKVYYRVVCEAPPPPIIKKSCIAVEPTQRLYRTSSYGYLPTTSVCCAPPALPPPPPPPCGPLPAPLSTSCSGTCLAYCQTPTYVYENYKCYNPISAYNYQSQGYYY